MAKSVAICVLVRSSMSLLPRADRGRCWVALRSCWILKKTRGRKQGDRLHRRTPPASVIERLADQPSASDNGVTGTTARLNWMASNGPISEYMQRHGCGFPDALEALAARLGPPTARDVRRALQTL